MSHHFVNQLIHLMWSTHDLQNYISPLIKSDLYAYITNTVKAKNGKVFATGGSTDHIHLLLLLPPEISLSSLLRELKACSSKWIKTKNLANPEFTWQQGFIAVTTQTDKVSKVCSYIESDESRHKSKSYSEELIFLLKQQNMDYNEKFYLQNSHAKMYMHMIWSTHNRIPWIDKSIRPDLYSHMSEIVKKNRGCMHSIGGIEDHIHILMEAPKDKALADLVKDVKTSAVHWIKKQDPLKYRDFQWQVGYGAFSLSYSSLEAVKQYIAGQEEHHRKQNFKEEWEEFLQKNGYQRFVH